MIHYAVIGSSVDTLRSLTSAENTTATTILNAVNVRHQFPNGIKFAIIITYNAARNPGAPAQVGAIID